MNTDDSAPSTEQLTAWLAAFDEALAAGAPLPAGNRSDLPAEAHARVQRGVDCMHLLRQLLAAQGATQASPPASPGEPAPVLPWTSLGRFQVRRELGRGAFGMVFLAYDPQLGREVALKVPRPDALANPELRQRFHQEARAAAGLDHPNLVPVYEAGALGPICYIASPYYPGITLATWLQQSREPIPFRLAARLLTLLADGVHHAHSRGVLHRDLKPSNVLLTVPPERATAAPSSDRATATADELGFVPKILDFGLAKVLPTLDPARPGEGDGPPTTSGAILGTPSYMAPEQAKGKNREVGPASDVYGLGAILYEMLTGRPPFRGETAFDTLWQVQTEEPVPPRRLRPKLPRDLETICLKCLEKAPAKRYESARALAEDLGRFLQDKPIVARPASLLYQVRQFSKRHRALVGGAAAVFLALTVGLVGTSLGLARAHRAEQEARQLLVDSYAQAAQLGLQRGAWRAALDNFDKALQAGQADSVRLRLDKVRAWCAVHEIPRAVTELQTLAQRTDLKEFEGAVLLWQADIALGRSIDDARALELVRQAVQKGLAPAEAAYAQGLLAETSAEALRHFRQAVERDPFHHRANGMLVLLLLLHGALAEAHQRVTVAELLFPEDPTLRVLHALLQAMENDLPGASAQLAQAQPQLAEQHLAAARALVELVHQMRHLDAALTGEPFALGKELLKLLPTASKVLLVQQSLRAPQTATSSGLLLPLPPVLMKAFPRLPALAPALLSIGNPTPVIEELDRASRVHPEGILYFARALLLSRQERWAEAETAFLAAAEAPSFFRLRRPALFGATMCEWILAGLEAPVPPARMRTRALQHTRALVALGSLPPEQASSLTQIALQMNEWDLARWILADWERQAPQDLEALRQRATVELRAGAYGRALEAAANLLARQPHDAQARAIRSAALDAMKKQLQTAGSVEKSPPN